MGQVYPNRPHGVRPPPPPATPAKVFQGRPKPTPPAPGPASPHAPLPGYVRCAYCGMSNLGTRCDGCGAPVDRTAGPVPARSVVPPFPKVRR